MVQDFEMETQSKVPVITGSEHLTQDKTPKRVLEKDRTKFQKRRRKNFSKLKTSNILRLFKKNIKLFNKGRLNKISTLLYFKKYSRNR